jgi:hypothetical protein
LKIEQRVSFLTPFFLAVQNNMATITQVRDTIAALQVDKATLQQTLAVCQYFYFRVLFVF